MAEESRLREQAGESGEKTDTIALGGRKPFDPTIYLLVLLTILVLSIAYFFVFALPKIQRDRLAWEKERYTRQQQVAGTYEACVEAAERDYESYVKLNATPVEGQAGAYEAPADVWETADRSRQSSLAECSRKFNR